MPPIRCLARLCHICILLGKEFCREQGQELALYEVAVNTGRMDDEGGGGRGRWWLGRMLHIKGVNLMKGAVLTWRVDDEDGERGHWRL